ncbi:hypothetical protein SAMN02745121_03910 [Nannocystis exedens]|uniref:Uncharacterized protein n=1 Tax=Nannocystis exedens TaxID=54 RepID=A0A1I1ZQX2_9BACT|nr:hypothetical protein [Nannocystis exedens]PCC75364.1 hypothetical protein NAEX_08474 [Nannocystis exedens]SFE34041.1 hypothetical protein SAMN02745121_03910 [Nannocystis exedens]
MLLALAILAVLAAAPIEVGTDLVDAGRLEAGLRARIGPTLDDWKITVTPTGQAGQVHVSIALRDGQRFGQAVQFAGKTVEDRTRELAASVALLIEVYPQHQASPLDGSTSPPASGSSAGQEQPPRQPGPGEPAPAKPLRPALRGWLGLGPRIELGSGLRFEAGVDLMGGLWLARDHVQPILSLNFSGGARHGISVLHGRFGAGAAFGAPLGPGDRLWLGAHLLAHALYIHAAEKATDATWLSSTEIGGLLQYRGRRLFLGLRTGIDLTLPAVSIRGTRGVVRREIPRWCFGLMVGVVFG